MIGHETYAQIEGLADYVQIVRQRWYLVALSAAISVASVLGVMVPKVGEYRATTQLVNIPSFSQQVYASSDPGLVVGHVKALVLSQEVASTVLARLPATEFSADVDTDHLMSFVDVYPVSQNTMLEIAAVHQDQGFAMQLADVWADTSRDRLGELYAQSVDRSRLHLEAQLAIAEQDYGAAQEVYQQALGKSRLSQLQVELDYATGYIESIAQMRHSRMAGIVEGIALSDGLLTAARELIAQLDAADSQKALALQGVFQTTMVQAYNVLSGLANVSVPATGGTQPVGPASPPAALHTVTLTLDEASVDREVMTATLRDTVILLETHREQLVDALESGVGALTQELDWPLILRSGEPQHSVSADSAELALATSRELMQERVRTLRPAIEAEQAVLTSTLTLRDNSLRRVADLSRQQLELLQKAGVSGINRTSVSVLPAQTSSLALHATLGLLGGIILGLVLALAVEYGSRYRGSVLGRSSED